MEMFDIDKLTEKNIESWIEENIENFDEIKPYPKGVFAQYHWWKKIISNIIVAFQVKEELREEKNKSDCSKT